MFKLEGLGIYLVEGRDLGWEGRVFVSLLGWSKEGVLV